LDEKTKEIVERLQSETDNQYSKIAHDLMINAADIITRLSERVKELETALSRIADHHSNVEPYDTDEACWDHIANLVLIAERALSKQGEGS
jgi:hypothetical protein